MFYIFVNFEEKKRKEGRPYSQDHKKVFNIYVFGKEKRKDSISENLEVSFRVNQKYSNLMTTGETLGLVSILLKCVYQE